MKSFKKRILICLLFLSAVIFGLTGCGNSFRVTDYTKEENWAMYGEGSGDADLFFIAPTVDMGKSGNYNMSLKDEELKASFLGATRMELGIYENTSVYVPYYQQAAFTVYSLSEEEQKVYFGNAYKDVKAAFEYYLKKCDSDRPLILAAFSQGADMLIRLMKDFGNDPAVSKRLVAAYDIGWRLTKDEVKEYPWLVPASGEYDTGCIVEFDLEAEGVTDSIIVPEGIWTYSINPLNWKTDDTPASAQENLGACFTEYSGAIKSEIPNLTGTVINPQRGTVICPDIKPEDYSSSLFPEGVYHLYDYQFVYRNLQKNVADRLQAWKEKQGQ